MSFVDFLEDVGGAIWDGTEFLGDVAGYAAPIVAMVNPGAGAVCAGFSVATNVVEKHVDKPKADEGGSQQPNAADTPEAMAAREAQREAIRENAVRQTADDVTQARKKLQAGGTDIFTVLAEVIGPKLQANIENLVDFAGTINTQSKDIFTDMAKLTGEQEKVKTSSAALGGILPAVGESMKNVSKG